MARQVCPLKRWFAITKKRPVDLSQATGISVRALGGYAAGRLPETENLITLIEATRDVVPAVAWLEYLESRRAA